MSSENQTAIQKENADAKKILREVYDILSEKGYNPITQIVGYLLSEDPTYITNCNNARALIRRVDRDVLMCELVKSYLSLDE
ncbi:MAG: IreB family regulatory phosphoprotein [Ruminococcaceae bacterium]|nr:IreB family regulatory phosphoprotein [Oscillospiraceae bacterium]